MRFQSISCLNPIFIFHSVAQSQNLISWTCKDTTVASFTILCVQTFGSYPYFTYTLLSSVGNQDPKISVAPLAIIPVQQNFQCSILVTQDQANQAAGTGWQIFFADILNITNVSLYPSCSAPSPINEDCSFYPSILPSPTPSKSGQLDQPILLRPLLTSRSLPTLLLVAAVAPLLPPPPPQRAAPRLLCPTACGLLLVPVLVRLLLSLAWLKLRT